MAEIVVLGAGIGGISMAYELRAQIGRKANITLLSDSEWFHFVPSNPWVAVNWRKPEDIKIHLPEILPETENWLRCQRGKTCSPERERDRTQGWPPPPL